MNTSGNITVFSERLTVINETTSPFNNVGESSFFIKEKNNQILFHKHNEQEIRKFNQFGDIEPIYFEINSKIDTSTNPFTEYDDNFLILVDLIGSSITTNPEYLWRRAVIQKYDLDMTHTFDEISYEDEDMDGITNNIDECRNTPVSETANSYGCSSSQTLNLIGYRIKDDIIITYPNPIKSIVNFNIDASTLYNLKLIEVYDNIGRRVLSMDDVKDIITGKLDLKNQKEGIYFIRFYFGNNQVLNKKIIKIH